MTIAEPAPTSAVAPPPGYVSLLTLRPIPFIQLTLFICAVDCIIPYSSAPERTDTDTTISTSSHSNNTSRRGYDICISLPAGHRKDADDEPQHTSTSTVPRQKGGCRACW
jgi:hypothetical protein